MLRKTFPDDATFPERTASIGEGRAVNGCEVLPAQPSQLADVIVCDVKVLKVLEREKMEEVPYSKAFFFLFVFSFSLRASSDCQHDANARLS